MSLVEWRQSAYVRQDEKEPTTYTVSHATADHPALSVYFDTGFRAWTWADQTQRSGFVFSVPHGRFASEAEAMSAAEAYYAEQPGLDQIWSMGEEE